MMSLVSMKKFVYLAGALVIVVVTTWFILVLRNPEARELAVRMEIL